MAVVTWLTMSRGMTLMFYSGGKVLLQGITSYLEGLEIYSLFLSLLWLQKLPLVQVVGLLILIRLS